jgi:hypothetical protein
MLSNLRAVPHMAQGVGLPGWQSSIGSSDHGRPRSTRGPDLVDICG